MKPLQRIAFVGNYLPRRCGIATFTHDLHGAVAACSGVEANVLAMTDRGNSYEYPSAVCGEIQADVLGDYAAAADFINTGGFDVVSLQHEFGIFGGEAGGYIVEILRHLKVPVVATLHSVLASPSPAQRDVMRQIVAHSSKVVVMASMGRHLLETVQNVPSRKIDVIPHGIPDFPFVEPTNAKAKLGFGGRTVVLTFGLLSPGKGIETVIDAMPGIVRSCPTAVYVVLGATHPNLVRDQGEAYRASLAARAVELGVADHVVFVDQFVDQATLLDYISMCDVYVTPYLNEDQMTSGTLAYSFGLGKAVVSTPYWHAKDLLSEGRGILVPFGDSQATGDEISALLADDRRRDSLRERAYAASREMTWGQTAKRYISTFEAARAAHEQMLSPLRVAVTASRRLFIAPDLRVGHFLSMCDNTGLLQHAVNSVPDRLHGYCVDDNARALLFSSALGGTDASQLPTKQITQFAAFIQHAWNPDRGRFRNFMSYDRRWLEEVGSEDSHGRTLWSLGQCAHLDVDPDRQNWAATLFMKALPAVEQFSSPRAWAFTLLGLDGYCKYRPADGAARGTRDLLANKLMSMFYAVKSDDWLWFEDSLAYDNARLPQALTVTGLATGNSEIMKVGTAALRWLLTVQSAPNGNFRPVGTESFGVKRQCPHAFDQQPVEAAATISACAAAQRATDNPAWANAAHRAFQWFLGANDLGATLIDRATGSCRDGLHPDRPNENMGAESALSYLLGQLDIRLFDHTVMPVQSNSAIKTVVPSRHGAFAKPTQGSYFGTVPLFDPPAPASASRSGAGGRTAV
jgi:glycosyltransferase involved in cell wall biosynthesis